jgi:cellulose synthase (UDP-forming)
LSVKDYEGASEILGPLTQPVNRVYWNRLLGKKDRRTVSLVTLAYTATVFGFIGYLVWPSHMPLTSGHTSGYAVLAWFGFGLIVALQVVQYLATVSNLHFALKAQTPTPMMPPVARYAMLTTIVPSKEPWEVALATMKVMATQRVPAGSTLDIWVLDEGNDPQIIADCEKYGFNHFSRKGVPHWNQETGPLKAKTKHGNHNAWREAHSAKYDFVSQMDPDHCPIDDQFLYRCAGYFHDPDVAFTVVPQAYGNAEDGLVAKGAGQLAYLFHGVIQPGTNGMGAPVLIGTNHIFRVSAWDQIGGYQDCIIEDHLTAMRVPTETNPVTGNRWKGIYSSDILTTGEGPNTWTDFFSQQARWAYGIFEIATKKTPKMWKRLDWHQRLSFASLQFFYPSTAATWLMGNTLSSLYLVGGVTSSRLQFIPWLCFFLVSNVLGLSVSLWLRRFNLMPHERASYNWTGMLLNLVTTPVYLAAGFQQLTGRNLVYKVTAKGRLSSGDSLQTFRLQIGWAAFAIFIQVAGLLQGHDYLPLYVWANITLAASLAPIAIWFFGARRTHEVFHPVDLDPVVRIPAQDVEGEYAALVTEAAVEKE